MNNSLSNLVSIAKVGLATAAGAFFGAVSMTTLPTTLDGWKTVLAPALGAAVFAEIYYLRQQIAAFLLSVQTPASVVPAPVVPAPTVPVAPEAK